MINIGLCGFGTVGKGVYDIIKSNTYLKENVQIKKILVSSLNKKRDIDKNLLTDNYKDIVNDQTIDLVIECIGGTTLAYDIIKESICNNKNVITANKAVLSSHLLELNNRAKEKRVKLLFESSVCAAIPCISVISDISKFDEIDSIEGIINGSTNFVLTKINEGLCLKEALSMARERGFLEADPTDDVCGYDALRKIIILSNISYNGIIDGSSFLTQRMDTLTDEFINYIKTKDLVIKFLATSKKIDDRVSISVMPTIISKDNLFSNIDNEKNCLILHTKYSNEQILTGYGAGRYPTASAIINDLIKIIENRTYTISLVNKYSLIQEKYKYLIESNKELNIDYTKKDGNFYYTNNIDFSEIEKNINDIICFARVYK